MVNESGLADRAFLDFTDMTIRDSLAYACTLSGQIFVINVARMEIENVRIVEPIIDRTAVNGVGGGGILINKSRSNKPALRLNSLAISDRYCVTGSDDGYVRVWPLDFTQVAIEAEHESSVRAVRFSPDSCKIATATLNGNLGKQKKNV